MQHSLSTKASRLPRPGHFYPAERDDTNQWRDNPNATDIEIIRKMYPVEDEFDLTLSRKMRRRGSGPYHLPSLAEMSGYLKSFLDAHISGKYTVTNEAWLTGGASKLQFGFTLEWMDKSNGPAKENIVVRMEPAESLNATSRRREFEIIRALANTVPVPRTFWMDPDGKWFPEPAILYGFVKGVTKPSADKQRVSGTGAKFSPQLRARLAPQFIEHLAAIHTFDWTQAELGSFNKPRVKSKDASIWQLNRARRVWEEDRGEDIPLVEYVGNWLEDNMPELDYASVLHGDYRSGNFLFDEASANITAWLDWERCYIGDRHRDIAWALTSLFGNYAEDGKTPLVCGLVPEQEFLHEYQRLSGLTIDNRRLHYFRVLNTYQLVVSCLSSTYRVSRLGKSHQDNLLVMVEGAVYPNAAELLKLLEEVVDD